MFFRRSLLLGGVTVVLGKVQYMGMNIAGFDFGCATDGTCTLSSVAPPITALGGADGVGQMKHFATDDQMNIFRLPVSWQYLVNNKLGGTLDSTKFGNYDQLMQACLDTGAYCVIDIHNFARWNDMIIGQSSGGPTDAQFADLWSQLATKYASETKVIFGLMNEPHDLDITTWATSCQAAVTAIRTAGATSQMILLPGTNFASAGQFVSSGSGAALIAITNLDGSTTNLILDLHKYLDSDNSGESSECTTDNIADAFALVADFLRTSGRLGLVTETGAGSSASCFTGFCAQNTYLNNNSDVFLGYIAWAAGSFATSYVLSETPTTSDGKFIDNALASQCVIAPWLSAGSATFTGTVASSTVASRSAITSNVVIATTSAGETGSAVTSSGSPVITSAAAVKSNVTSTLKTTLVANATASATGNSTKTATSTSVQVSVTGGAGMRKLAGHLLIGSFVAVVFL